MHFPYKYSIFETAVLVVVLVKRTLHFIIISDPAPPPPPPPTPTPNFNPISTDLILTLILLIIIVSHPPAPSYE